MKENGDNRTAQVFSLFCRTPLVEIGPLAAKLEVSERTIRNDIKQLNVHLKGCAAIEGGQGKYRLNIYDNEKFQAVRDRILDSDGGFNSPPNRQNYILGRLMRAQEPLLTDELAYEMSIGRTTLVSDLKKLRADLEPYHLSVLGLTSKGLVLQGSENEIRRCILERSYDALYRDYPLDVEIVDMVAQSFARSPVERSTQQRFQRFLTVMLDRYMTGHPIGELPASFYRLTARPEFLMVNQLADQIAAFLHVEIPVEEKLFVLPPIVGMRTPADMLDMRSIDLDDATRTLKEKIFHQIQLEMDITITSPEFEEEFLYHLMFMLNRLRFHVRLEDSMGAELREKYPLAWRMAGVASRVVREEHGLEVTEAEHSYLASYFGVFLEESGLKKSRPFRAAVVCGTGRVTARLVAAQLRRVLDSATELTLLSSEKVLAGSLEEFDLIFTTVELPRKPEKPVIFIREIFNEQELRHKIEKAKYWDQVEVPILDNNWFVMVGLLDESRFFVLDKAKTYAQALEQMAGALADQGQVDGGFPDRLRAREKIGSTVFDRSVAIPHSVQFAGDRLVLAVGACPEPIQEGGQEIKAVFLLGLPEDAGSDDALLIRVYEEIISAAKDGELLEKISKANNFPALLRALYRHA